ncbi:MAG: acyltransferase family protein, partial [Acidimicrobiales bacterium]
MALVGVLAYHVAPGSISGGFLGVEVFFVLSGYLLASVLLDEHRRTGTVELWRYAARRARRIGPGVGVLLAALVVFGPLLAPDAAHRLAGDIVSSLAGVTNWHLIADGSSYFQRVGRPSSVRHLWSVAVEVQFYVLCPFLVAGLARWRRRRLAVAALAVGIGASAVTMGLVYRAGDPSRAYFGTDARVGALLSGVLVAVLLASRQGLPTSTSTSPGFRWIPRLDRLGVAALVVLGCLYVLADDRARLSYPAAFLAAQAATAVLIVAVRHRGPAAWVLRWEPLRWLGVRSFGIYLWHWPLVVLLRPGVDVGWSPVVTALATVVLAVALGTLSYGLVERPLLRRPLPGPKSPRPRLTLASAVGAAALGVVSLMALLARLPTADPLAETLRAGEHLLAAQPLPTATPGTMEVQIPVPAAEPVTPEGPVAPGPAPAAPPVPAPAPAVVPVTAIGDSVMISAAGALQSRLGPSVYIDARSSRQFSEGIPLVRQMREEQRLAPTAVVHLGNNGPVRAQDIDALMVELADVARVVMVNVRVDAPWRDSVNQSLAEAAERYPSIRLVDWSQSSDGHRAWFQSDGTHFKTTSGPGANAYADLIAEAVAPAPASATVPTPATPPP